MILSVDPGIKGALAVRGGGSLIVWGMPTYIRTAGARSTSRAFIDEGAVLERVQEAHMLGCNLFVAEEVGGLPHQSAAGAFTFGRGYGAVIMAARACGMRLETVKAATWKQRLRVPADKRAATMRATELMPEHAAQWAVRRGSVDQEHANGRAEAAMVGLYAERFL